jgi:histidyl-tRNA synthetase
MSTEADIAALEAEIVTQTVKFNELRLSGQPHDDAKKTLSDLKRRLALAKSAGKPKDKLGKGDAVQEKKKEPLLLKTAKARHQEH